MAAGVFTASLASPTRIDKASSGENQRPQKSWVAKALVTAGDTANTGITTSYAQISSTFDNANNPAMWFKLLWTYGSTAATLSVRFKVSGDLVNDPFDWAESTDAPASGTSVQSILTVTFAKATWDLGAGVANCPVSILDPRRRYVQLWAKADNAAANTLDGWVGGGTNG